MTNVQNASPGVYTSEKDLTFTTETIGVTTLGAVGETQKGPAFQPFFIKNYGDFKTMFGGLNPEKFKNTQIVKYELPYIAKSYLSQSNQLFVTRILGLSGYNKGNAFAIRTLGALDASSLSYTTTTSTIPFSVNTTGNTFNSGSGLLIDQIATTTGVDKTKYKKTFDIFFNTSNYATKGWYKHDILYWGDIPSAITTSVKATDLSDTGTSNPALVDAYELPLNIAPSDELNSILINEFTYDEGTQTYKNNSFIFYTYGLTGVTGSIINGTVKVTKISWTANPNLNYHNKLISTLRSRANYSSDVLGFDVNSSSIAFDSLNAVETNPLATFNITGATTGGTHFSYSVCLDNTKKNYIKKVLGTGAFDRDTHLYVEETYDATLAAGIANGHIRGIHRQIVNINDWNHFKFQYQSPVTPYFVSELRGGKPQKLFRFISISDGDSANTEIKVSIANVDLDKKTFDVYIRSYSDSDKAPVLLERYLTCTLNSTLNNYIGKKIGTFDGQFQRISSYVLIDLDDNAPSDAVPSGFAGYTFRTEANVGIPEIPYKTQYYKAGDLVSQPPLSAASFSNGDKVRKAFLGFSDTQYGYDSDLLSFKGEQRLTNELTFNDGIEWSGLTKGFHLDVNADPTLFAVGTGTFTDAATIASDPTHPYNDIRTRKFTALFHGGFDGWDIFRTSRTNTDTYKIGKTGFVNSGFDTFTNPEFDELMGSSDYYAYLLGVMEFQNPENTSINILVTPGIDLINNTMLSEDVIEIVEEKRRDAIYIPTLPDIQLLNNTSPSDQNTWLFPNDIISELEITGIDSNYTACFYPWIQIPDTENSAFLFIPPTAEVVRNLAFTDNVAFPWFATAGYNRGVVNCNRARIVLDQDARDILYPGRINPIATFSDVGVLIWGNRNLQIADSALNRLNIRRLLLQAKKLIVAVANRLLFDPNDQTIRNQFLALVNPILDNIRQERGLTDFRVSLDPQSTATDTDRNTMSGKIFLKPTPSLEFIQLEFDVTPQGVNFDNL